MRPWLVAQYELPIKNHSSIFRIEVIKISLFYSSGNNARMITRLGRQAINPPLSGIFPI
jgi:hypothetical protein